MFCVEPERDHNTTSPPAVVIGSAVPTSTCVVALNKTSAVVEVFTVVAPPMLSAPAEAIADIPSAPDAVKFADVVTVVPVIEIPPEADRAAVIETAPVAGIEMLPVAVEVVIELETVVAAALTVTGPATVREPPEMVTPEVLPTLPILKPEVGPETVRLVVLNVDVKELPDDSKTTAPVVLICNVGEPFSESAMTVTSPLDAVAPDRAARLTVPVQ